MTSNLDAVQAELRKLYDTGADLYKALYADPMPFKTGYQRWYTEARRVVAQLLPERLEDFTSQYERPKARREINYDTYRISDWLQNTRLSVGGTPLFDTDGRAASQLLIQLQILDAARLRFTSKLMDLREIVLADLYDTELEKALGLLKQRLLREAGVIAGVVLEAHLQDVAKAREIKIAKKAPTIGDLNDPLKNAGIYDTPTWRFVQRLADIRNLCDHKKDREPTADEVLEFIQGVDKIAKTVS